MKPGETLIEMARRHVAEGESHVAGQRQLIARLEDRSLPTQEAWALLAQFEQALASHRAHFDQIRREQLAGRRDSAGNLSFGGPHFSRR